MTNVVKCCETLEGNPGGHLVSRFDLLFVGNIRQTWEMMIMIDDYNNLLER